MEKQCPSIIKIWQKRYFVLDDTTLKYYKTKSQYMNGLPPKGVLNFQLVGVKHEFNDMQKKISL